MLNETLEAEREYQKTLIEEYDRGYKKGFADAKLEQQEQQWIPCMPTTMPDTDEELWSDYVLVTRRGYYPNGKEWRIVEEASYCEKLLSSDGRYRDTPGWAIGKENYSTDCIIAWMPLPKVYEVRGQCGINERKKMMETNKYIIELEEMIVSTADGQMPFYKIKGFNTPIFDSAGVRKLTPYTELDVKAIRDEAYDNGLNDGWTNVHNECEAAYQNGLYDAWDAARKIFSMDGEVRETLLHNCFFKDVIENISASEAVEKIRQYEQEQEEIKVGDEVNGKGGKGIITRISDDGDHFNVMWENGSTGYYMMEDFKKTGRHFPEIAEVLKKMQEETK